MTFLIKTYFVFLYFDRDLLPTKHQIFKNMRKNMYIEWSECFQAAKGEHEKQRKMFNFSTT